MRTGESDRARSLARSQGGISEERRSAPAINESARACTYENWPCRASAERTFLIACLYIMPLNKAAVTAGDYCALRHVLKRTKNRKSCARWLD